MGAIRGKILSKDRALFKNFGVDIQVRNPIKTDMDVEGSAQAAFDENGEFHIPIILAGPISIIFIGSRAIDHELVEVAKPSPQVIPSNGTLELEFELPRTVQISGVVLTSDTRQPVPGAQIHYSSGRARRSIHSRSCVTDENGEFKAFVVPGKVRFQMTALSKPSTTPFRYDYPRNFPDEITQDTKLEVLLPVSKLLKGRLRDAAGNPIANQMIARHTGRYRHLCGLATTDASGHFEMYVHNWPLSEGYWVMIDRKEADLRQETVVYQISNNDDFYVLERPTVPASPPKSNLR